MINLFLKGGILMYPIFICSIIAIATFLERFIYLTIIDLRNKKFFKAVKQIKNSSFENIRKLSLKFNTPISNLLSSAIENINKGEEERNIIINRIGSKEVQDLEKNVNLLGVIAHITPLLGLLGTVTGMIRCFMTIQKLGGQVDAVNLAGGIWEALITTAAGLSVAIPTLIFLHFLERKIDNIISLMKDLPIFFPEVFSKYQIKPTRQIEEE